MFKEEFDIKKELGLKPTSPKLKLTHLQSLRLFQLIETYARMRLKMNTHSFHFINMKSIDFNFISTKINRDVLKSALFQRFNALYLFHGCEYINGSLRGFFGVDFNKINHFSIEQEVKMNKLLDFNNTIKSQSDFIHLLHCSDGKIKMPIDFIVKIKSALIKINSFQQDEIKCSFHFKSITLEMKVKDLLQLVTSDIVVFSQHEGHIFAHLSVNWWTEIGTSNDPKSIS